MYSTGASKKKQPKPTEALNSTTKEMRHRFMKKANKHKQTIRRREREEEPGQSKEKKTTI